jgi:PAS domain-containing protein
VVSKKNLPLHPRSEGSVEAGRWRLRPILDLRARIVLARPAARWRQTVVNQIIEDMFGYPVGVILTGLRQVDDLVDDDFDHRIINITIEQEGVAESA